MTFDFRVPVPPLRDFVSLIWYWNGVSRPHAMERLMPNAEAALIVNLKDDEIRVYDKDTLELRERTKGATLVGVHSQPCVIDCEEQETVFGVQFRPGGAFPFFGGPADATANDHMDLSQAWGRADASALRDELLETGGRAHAMFEVAERYLMARLRVSRRHPAVDFAIREIARTRGGVPQSQLVDKTGLSARRFIELFRREAGLSPKVFARVQRFQAVLRSVRGRRNPDWAETAAVCGYYDQSHLIHDFQGFAGMTPAVYAAAATSHMNHVPILES